MAFIFDSFLADVGVAVVTCFVMAYLYYANKYKYWEKRGVHYVKPTMFFGNLGSLAFQRESLGQLLKKVYHQNPDEPFVGIFAGIIPILVIRDLDVVRNILVKDAHAFLDRYIEVTDSKSLVARNLFVLKGKKWRHMRVKLTPTFTSGKIKKMFQLISACGKDLLHCIDQEMAKGKNVVVKETVARYSTDVIASCAFGVNANALADPNCEFRATMRKIFEPPGFRRFAALLTVFAPWLPKLIKLQTLPSEISDFVRRTFWDVANYRKTNGVVRKDFVDILMQIKNEGEVRVEDSKEAEEIEHDTKFMNKGHSREDKLNIRLEDDDFVAQAFVFIAAGFETSSSVISFTLYELALNASIQDKLRRDMQEILKKHNNEVTYDAIAEMTYLEMVVSETLRKYPTVPQLERKCLQDYKIPGTEITIEKGTHVKIPVLGIHWDPTIYPQPDKFDPERFSPENKRKRSSFAHLPFGEGPRICIGMRFGQMQVKTALVHILTSYQINTCAGTPPVPLEMKPTAGVTTPKKDIILEFEKLT